MRKPRSKLAKLSWAKRLDVLLIEMILVVGQS